MPIKISVSGLAKFMKSGPASQRSLLRAYKFQTDKYGNKRPQIVRYSEARAAVRKFHEKGNDPSSLESAVAGLEKKLALNSDKDSGRIRDNIRAIRAYLKNFSKNKYEVLENPKPKYVHQNVEVSATPDLFVDEAGVKKMIKLDFNAAPPDADSINVILKVMHEASVAQQIGIQPKNVIYLDVTRNATYTGAKLNKKLKKDIDATCETIEDIWPKVKQ